MSERYGVPFASQSSDVRAKVVASNLDRFGTEAPAQSEEVRQRMRETCMARYGSESPFTMAGFREKSKATCLDRYGVEHTGQIESAKAKRAMTNLDKYGSTYPLGNSDIRRKASVGSDMSSLELRLNRYLDNYGIPYDAHHVIQGDGFSHEFDVYLPEHKILVDCDGTWFHGYDSDADGRFSDITRDERRVLLVPDDHVFVIIVESDFERGLRELQRAIDMSSKGTDGYRSKLFEWCRNIGFPYPNYSDNRLHSDYAKLRSSDPETASNGNWMGLSSIRHFHRSLWDCHVKGKPSVREAWDDDSLLRKAIDNRLVYKDEVDPSKVLAGLYISKIAPKVSVFRPMLAKRLVAEYLSEFDSVFDPFSGFSGRMLGVCASGKRYIGRDVREKSISESVEIRDYHDLNADLAVADVLESGGSYECLLTCPPYGDQEIYEPSCSARSSDDWILECLTRFCCERYVFVVGNTDKFEAFVSKRLHVRSHMRDTDESVVVISRDARDELIGI